MRARWFSKKSLLLHLAVAVWVTGCSVAAYWQVTVALAGDKLGWLYSVEWPIFGIFGVVVWWNALHDDPSTVGTLGLRRAREWPSSTPEVAVERTSVRRPEEEDGDLAAYNDFLLALAESGERKTWRRR